MPTLTILLQTDFDKQQLLLPFACYRQRAFALTKRNTEHFIF